MSDRKPTVHVVDPDPDLRHALTCLVEGNGWHAAAYPDADAFLARVPPPHPGCLLAELHLPGRNGLALQAALLDQEFPLPLVFLSGRPNIRDAVAAVRQGAAEVLEKPVDETELVAALDQAIADSADAIERTTLRSLLSGREREIEALMRERMLNKEIAFGLGISEKTVEFHKRNIRRKAQEAGLTLV